METNTNNQASDKNNQAWWQDPKFLQKQSLIGTIMSFVLFFLFLGLKLGGSINWSWWWITIPLWGGIAVYIGVTIIFIIIGAILALFGVDISKFQNKQ